MRQSDKETKLLRMMQMGMSPDRREAKSFMEMTQAEFAVEWHGAQPGSSRNGRRSSPGGRG